MFSPVEGPAQKHQTTICCGRVMSTWAENWATDCVVIWVGLSCVDTMLTQLRPAAQPFSADEHARVSRLSYGGYSW